LQLLRPFQEVAAAAWAVADAVTKK
jgi:hypothetical protein